MAIKNVYKSHLPSVNYVTVRGRTCIFKEGRFETDQLEEIAELDQLVRDKSNPHIYVDEAEKTIDTTLQERIKEAQREATLRVLEEAAQQAQNSGQTEQKSTPQVTQAPSMSAATLLGVTSSAGVAQLASQSNQK